MIDIDLQRFKDLLKVTKRDGTTFIFDPIRKKDIVLLPEELVRQLLLRYLLEDRKYSKNLIKVEKAININNQMKRFDLVIYDNNAKPKILVECKRPEEKINQNVFNQISTYNLALQADYMVVTNGVSTYCCRMDYENNTYDFLDSLPTKETLVNTLTK